MLKTLLAVATTTVCLASAAIAAPEDDYATLKIAIALEGACGGAFKYFEYDRITQAASKLIAEAPQTVRYLDERIPEADYEAWLGGIESMIAVQAHSIGCNPANAGPYISAAKGVASEQVYQDLVLAFYFASLEEDDFNRLAMQPSQVQAVQRYDAYLQGLYRENFTAFSARQREIASAELPVVNIFDPTGGLLGNGFDLETTEEERRLWDARNTASATLDDVVMEVTAEINGYVVRPLKLKSGATIPQLQRPAEAIAPMPVISGPGYALFNPAPDDPSTVLQLLYSIAVLTPEEKVRIMFYGEAAASLTNPTIRLYVRNEGRAEGLSQWETYEQPDFRDKATAFDAVKLAEGCMGEMCVEFPVEATAALIAHEEGDYAELVIEAPRATQPVKGSRGSRFANYRVWQVLKGN